MKAVVNNTSLKLWKDRRTMSAEGAVEEAVAAVCAVVEQRRRSSIAPRSKIFC